MEGRVSTVFWRSRQTDTGGHFVLLGLQIIELDFITERPPGIPYQTVLNNLRLSRLLITASGAACEEGHAEQ